MITKFKLYESTTRVRLVNLIMTKDEEGIRQYVKEGGNLNQKINGEVTPLNFAIEYIPVMAKILIDLGANYNLSNKNGFPSLYVAIQKNRKDIVDMIINDKNFNPNKKIIEYSSERGNEYTSYLEIAITKNQMRIVYKLIDKGANITNFNIYSASKKNDKIVQKLIKNAKTSVLKEIDEDSGETLLFDVSLDSILLLLERGVDMTIPNNNGEYFFVNFPQNKHLIDSFENDLKTKLPKQWETYVMLKNLEKYDI